MAKKRAPAITAGILAPDRTLYVLSKYSGAEEDDRRVLSGRIDGGAVALERREEIADLVSFVALNAPFEEHAAGLTGSGEVVLFSGTTSRREQVVPTRAKLGRMTRLVQVGEQLLALGYGGQVYTRTPSRGWRLLGARKDRDEESLVYFCAAAHGGRLYFGGTRRKNFSNTPELEAAMAAGDSKARARAFLAAAAAKSSAVVSAYDGSWSEIALARPGTVVEMLVRAGTLDMFMSKGRVVSTSDGHAFREVSLGSRRIFWDIKSTETETLVCVDGALFRWIGELAPFNPALPAIEGGLLNISTHAAAIGAFGPHQFFELSGREWARVALS